MKDSLNYEPSLSDSIFQRGMFLEQSSVVVVNMDRRVQAVKLTRLALLQ